MTDKHVTSNNPIDVMQPDLTRVTRIIFHIIPMEGEFPPGLPSTSNTYISYQVTKMSEFRSTLKKKLFMEKHFI